MISFFRKFLMVLGVLFFMQLIGLGYLVIADPFNLRPLMTMMWSAATPVATSATNISRDNPADNQMPTTDSGATATKTSESSGVTSAQAKALQSVGLDASAIANITPNQEACFVGILGATRVKDIKAGAVPTASEFFSVRGCL